MPVRGEEGRTVRRTTTTRDVLAALAATALAALSTAACGASQGTELTRPEANSSPDAGKALTRTVFPTDRDFTAAQLDAALPTPAQVGDARKVELRCHPGRKSGSCDPATQAVYAETVLSTDHTRAGTVTDHTRPGHWRPELYDLTAKRYVDRATAAAGWKSQVDQLRYTDGAFSTKATKSDGGQRWGSRGTGQISRNKVLGLEGLQVLATVKDVDLDGNTSRQLQVAIVACHWGQELASVKVVFWDQHHQPGEALNRATTVLEQYLLRLAKSG
jgi:hypothetical protein